MKKSLLLLFFIAVLHVFAYTQGELATMAAEHPELLQTPQAQEYLKKNHNVGSSKDSQAKIVQPTIQNNIEEVPSFDDTPSAPKQTAEVLTEDKKLTQKVKSETILHDGSLRLSPLKYKSTNAQLKAIKSAQMHPQGGIKLERYSKEFFRNKNKIQQNTISVPQNYTLNRGDIIRFWIYGKTEKHFELTVNNEGNIDIPQVGPVRVAGEKYAEVKKLLTNYLSSSYKNSRVVVSLNAFSNAQVTVTGFVNAPGIYNTTSVSSLKDILIQAGGVSDVGSVRNIEIRRDGNVVKVVDFYDLITNGIDEGDFVLKPNDVIHVPRAQGLVSIMGSVYKQAIYEIKEGESIYDILSFAGGLRPDADGVSISLKRYIRNAQIQNMTLSVSQAMRMQARDGDELYIYGLNTTQDNYVMITGNVVREGKRSIRGSRMSLRALLKREIHGDLNSFFLENTRFDYAMIKRIGKDTKPRVFKVNLKAILDGRSDFMLHNHDELYVFNELDTGASPYVTIEGTPLIKPGKYIYHRGMTLMDLINQAGVKEEYDKSKVRIVSKQDQNGKSKVRVVNLNQVRNLPLHERDSVMLFALKETHPMPKATISGEVIKPGSYPVSDGMTLADFIKLSGGLNEKAYPYDCEIIRYRIENGERKKQIINLPLKEAHTFLIKKHDEINIRRIPDWNKRRTVTIQGEVRFPGTYVIHSGEKLSSVIERAGGFTDRAFLYGAIFTRKSVRELQRKALQEQLSRLKEQVILVHVRNSSVPNRTPSNLTSIVQAVDSLIAESKRFQPQGRITIDLDRDLALFEDSPSNLTLEDGDVLRIPSYNDTVVVNGEVMMPTTLTYQGGDIKSYLDKSGGLTHLADNEHIYVIHANGEAERANIGSWLFSSNDVEIRKGDVITVPKKFYYDTRNIELTKDIADILYKIALTVASAHTVGAL